MIIIGAEESDKDKGTKGLYLFDDTPGVHYKDQRDYNLGDATPRFVTSRNKQCYALTRRGISELSIDRKIEVVDSILFKDLLSKKFDPNLKEDKLEENTLDVMSNREDLAGGLAFLPNSSLVVTLYLPENGKLELEDSGTKLSRYGYLLHSASGKLQDLTFEKKIEPSGKPILGENNSIIIPSGKRLEQILIEGDCIDSKPIIRFEHAAHAAVHLEGFTVGTSVAEGYVIRHWNEDLKKEARSDFQKGHDFDPVFTPTGDPAQSEYLPSESRSIALIRYPRDTEDDYAIFGLDDGFIRIYKLQVNGENVQVEYANDFSLLSLNKFGFTEADKDNHIYNLKVHNDLVSFSLRNMYIQMGFQKMLTTKARITSEDEKADLPDTTTDIIKPSKKELYLDKLKKTYGLSQICMVPHRIDSWCWL